MKKITKSLGFFWKASGESMAQTLSHYNAENFCFGRSKKDAVNEIEWCKREKIIGKNAKPKVYKAYLILEEIDA
jgi:hypothetical protein